MNTCCQCPSPARAELDGRAYCFTHVPLLTNWRPIRREKKKQRANKETSSCKNKLVSA